MSRLTLTNRTGARTAIALAFGILTAMAFSAMAFSSASAQDDAVDYRGNVYVEIRIDDDGIILIDSTGNETMVPLDAEYRVTDDGTSDRLRGLGVDIDVNPDDYPRKRARINAIGKSVVIDDDEHVYGSVTVIGGNATIRGLVEGSVTATGYVRLESTAVVVGDVIASSVIRESGATVVGDVSEEVIPGPPDPGWVNPDHDPTAAFVTGLIYMTVLLLFTFVVAMVFQKATDRVKLLYSRNILKTLLFGFIAWLLLLPVFILLLITIIGIPVALLGMPLAMLAAAFLGGAAFCLFVSDFLKSGNNGEKESRASKILMGFVIVQIPTVGFFLGLMVNAEALAIISGIMSGLLNLLVITLGFGGAILTRFGTRDYHDGKVKFKVEVVDDEGGTTSYESPRTE